MEVFKYITQKHLDVTRHHNALLPRESDGKIYGIPGDPTLWEEATTEIFNHLMKWSGVSPVILIKFVLGDDDANALVQDGADYVWDKMNNRNPIADYVREDYILPEVIVSHPIQFGDIIVIGEVPLGSVDQE